MFAQSEAVLRLIRFTVTTHNVDGSMTAFGPAARKRGLHGPRPPQGTPTHVSATLTILAVALGSCHAFMVVRSATSSHRGDGVPRRIAGVAMHVFVVQGSSGQMLRTARFTMREPFLWCYAERILQSVPRNAQNLKPMVPS